MNPTLAEAVAAVIDQARQKVRFDDADRSGVTIHAGLLRRLAEAAGMDPLPAYFEAMARSERVQAWLNSPSEYPNTGE